MSQGKGRHRFRRWSVGLQALILFFLMLRVGIAPSLDLDPTWTEILGWAHAHRLKAGIDYVFTYGPLGFLYPLAGYYPGSAKIFLNAQILMAGGEAIVIALALRDTSLWVSATCIAVFALWVPWLAGDLQWYATFAFAFVLASQAAQFGRQARIFVLAGIALLLAAIALIKFTSAVVFMLWICAVAASHLVERKRVSAVILVGAAIAAYLLLWHFAAQPFSTWPEYMRASFEVAGGYTAAMGQADDRISIGIALLAFAMCGALVLAALVRDRAQSSIRVGAVFLLGLLAIVWRAGATRYGHWPIFFGFASLLPYCAICLRRTVSSRIEVAICACSLLMSLLLLAVVSVTPNFLLSELKTTLSLNARALFHRKSFLVQRKDEWLAFAKSIDLPRIKAAVGDGTVDLLMTDQGLVLAMGLDYDPRPVFQSYSAYTPELARRNEAHFAGADAPKFVILKMQPIDERLPMQEDGLALDMLLRRYRPRLMEAGYLLLERSGPPIAIGDRMPVITPHDAARLGQDITLTSTEPHLLLFADVQLTLLGRLRALTLREPALAIVVATRGGAVKRFRLLRATARSGFLLSPLLTSAADWLKLSSHDRDNEVVSFRIEAMERADQDAFEEEFHYATQPVAGPIAMTDLDAYTTVAAYPSFSDPASDQSRVFDVLAENGEAVLSMHAPAWIEFELRPGTFTATGVAGIRAEAFADPACLGAEVDGVDFSLTVAADGGAPREIWAQRIDPFQGSNSRAATAFVTPRFTVERQALARLRIDPRANITCDWSYLGALRFKREGD